MGEKATQVLLHVEDTLEVVVSLRKEGTEFGIFDVVLEVGTVLGVTWFALDVPISSLVVHGGDLFALL